MRKSTLGGLRMSLMFQACFTVFLCLSPIRGVALPEKLGDLDEDSMATVNDLSILINHLTGFSRLSTEMASFADLNQDGVINEIDADLLADAILGDPLPEVPVTQIRETAPANAEDKVAVTRETVIRFTQPLSSMTALGTNDFFAEFGGRKLPGRIEIANNRRSATLFYSNMLPGSARIRVTFRGDTILDFLDKAIDADGDGTPGGTYSFTFDTLTVTPLANTIVCGRVFASELAIPSAGQTNISVNEGLEGVIITADGLEDQVRAITDAMGNFRITNAPGGHFFVHIDGRPASPGFPSGAYYPFVGKEWVSSPGGETNIGEVYLPLISEGTLQQVSSVEETMITFPEIVLSDHPELDGVSLMVPPDALLQPDGTRGGMIGIAPVPPDRIPGQLPDGLNFPIVITVQTDGAENFNEPVPVCLPNLPDPNTGEALPPGSKSALWSFNHDTGAFEVIGPMTVSEDGSLVCSDAGVGILAPGWHGTGPGGPGCCGPPGPGPGPDPPPDDKCNPQIQSCPDPDDPDQCPTNPILLYSGEKFEQVTDLSIKGVGMDFVWTRSYSSRVGPDTAQGNGWDFSHNMFLVQDGQGLRLCNGAGRDDHYRPVVDAGFAALGGGAVPTTAWARAGFFQQIELIEEGFQLLMADQKTFYFNPFDGTPQAGKINRIEDRNGNTIRYQYDQLGRLIQIIDTLNRPITVSYNAAGFIESITDFSGRSVRYAYYGNGEAGGSFGDLKSATSPAVVGTPNGNDFPNGKTTSYTYSKGFLDERLNHNLLTITDGRRNDPNDPTFGQGPYLINVYSTITNPEDINFDRVLRQIRGGDIVDLTYLRQTPSPENNQAVTKVILNDRVGNVSERYYDVGHRLVLLREFTGRANPIEPTTENVNRPKNPLRATDPPWFETRHSYNGDSKRIRTLHPNGNITEYVYEADLNPTAPARIRGNLRLVRRLPGTHKPAGDQMQITETYEYDSNFGCVSCGFNFVTRHVDGRGNETLSQFDENGNLTNRIHRIPTITEQWEYNNRGQMTRHTLPDNGSGHHRTDVYTYYESGPQRGYLHQEIIDAPNLALTTIYQYDLVGNVTKRTAPRGQSSQYIINQMDQIVREISPEVTVDSGIHYQKDYYYDGNNNLVRKDTENRNTDGVLQPNTHFTTTYSYDILNFLTSKSEEVSPDHSITTEYAYDGNRNRVLTRFGEATAGRQAHNVVQTVYDERNLPFKEIRAPGSAEQSTTQFDYDQNRNRIRLSHGLEATPHDIVYSFDGYNRLVKLTDPMGNVTSHSYDPNNNRTSTVLMGELEDLPGQTGNIRLSATTWTYDQIDRNVQEDMAFFDTATQTNLFDGFATTQTIYSDNSQVLAVINDNNHGMTNHFDTANRLMTVIDAKGNEMTYSYDADSNLNSLIEEEISDVDGHIETFTTTFAYDLLNRLTASTDNVGNMNRSGYDSRNNRTLAIDANSNVVRYTYDGLNRQLETIREMTATGVGGSPVVDTIITRQLWDDSSRLVAQIDDNTNATTYVYDGLNRKVATVYADSTGETNWFDVHDTAMLFTDANGNWVTNTYDLNDRLIRKDVSVGPGVSLDTTFEVYKYDGLDRLVYAEDDDSVVMRGYDSLSHVTRENQNQGEVLSLFDGVGNNVLCIYPVLPTMDAVIPNLPQPPRRTIMTTYDALERKKRIADTNGFFAVYFYVGPQRVSQRDYSNGVRLTYDYDGITGVANPPGDFGVKRIIRTGHARISDGVILDERTYTWDRVGNKVQAADVRAGGPLSAWDYVHDSAYRITNSTRSVPGAFVESVAYALDGVGNRLRVSGATNGGAYSLNVTLPEPADLQLNQYTSTPWDTRTYDANGNLTLADQGPGVAHVFNYDFRNRLVSFTNSLTAVSVSYGYDALGRRITKDVKPPAAGAITGDSFFIYDDWMCIAEIGPLADVVRSAKTYVYGNYIDEVLQVNGSDGESFFHQDELFSVVASTAADGSISSRMEYDTFGTAFAGVPSPYGFTGRRLDMETGLYYYRTRYLDVEAGRFTSRDSIGIWGDAGNLGNGYTYIGNNPLNALDPMGTSPQCKACWAACLAAGLKYVKCAKKCEKLCNLMTDPIEHREPSKKQEGCWRVTKYYPPFFQDFSVDDPVDCPPCL